PARALGQRAVDAALQLALDQSRLTHHPEDHPGQHRGRQQHRRALEDLLGRAMELGPQDLECDEHAEADGDSRHYAGPHQARVAEFLGLSGASVSEMVHRLERDGLVRLNGRKEIVLTEPGTALAAAIVRRHRLLERMLTDLLGSAWWATHDEAERLEHAISPEMERHLIERLG